MCMDAETVRESRPPQTRIHIPQLSTIKGASDGRHPRSHGIMGISDFIPGTVTKPMGQCFSESLMDPWYSLHE